MFCRQFRILRAGPDDDRDSGFDQLPDAFLTLIIRQQRPVAHGTTVNDAIHPDRHQFRGFAHQGGVIRRAIGQAWSHYGGNTTTEYI